jgi:4-hydroxy-tetrahydrodipicolinate reductase
MINVAIVGITGKMGTLLANRLDDIKLFVNIFGICHNKTPNKGFFSDKIMFFDDLNDIIKRVDLVIDFSDVENTSDIIDICVENGINLIIGTTGLSEDIFKKIEIAGENIIIVQSENYSRGITMISEWLRQSNLSGYDIKITETHHITKKDVPSGTALLLNNMLDNSAEIISVRDSDEIGNHVIEITNGNEIIKIEHTALNREIFIDGIIQSIRTIDDYFDKGWYNMHDVYKADL